MVIATIFFSIKYYKERRKVFTIKKISLIATLFAFFLIQVTTTIALSNFRQLPFSFDSLTVILVGFFIGPLEAMIYGAVADIVRVFMVPTWVPQAIYALTFPITGLVSGIAGILYKKSYFKSKSSLIISFHILIAILFFAPLIISLVSPGAMEETNIDSWIIYTSMGVSIFLLEFLFLWNFFKSNFKNLRLIFFTIMISIITRIVNGLVLTTYGDYFYWNVPFSFALLGRVITSSYLIPSSAMLSFILISSMEYSKKAANFKF